LKRDEGVEGKVLEAIRGRFKERGEVHLAELIYCLRKAYLRRSHPAPTPDPTALLWTSGQFYHDNLGFDTTDLEVRLDGIVGHVDAVLDGKPVEIKSTRQREGRDVKENEAWFRQLMGYCRMMGVREGILLVIYTMGDWKELKPSLKAYRVSFEEGELSENWQRVLEAKGQLESALKSQSPPPPRPSFSYECRSCEVKNICFEIGR